MTFRPVNSLAAAYHEAKKRVTCIETRIDGAGQDIVEETNITEAGVGGGIGDWFHASQRRRPV